MCAIQSISQVSYAASSPQIGQPRLAAAPASTAEHEEQPQLLGLPRKAAIPGTIFSADSEYDPLQVSMLKSVPGRLTYTSNFSKVMHLGLVESSQTVSSNADTNIMRTIWTYPLQKPPQDPAPRFLLHPLFSPDGRYILFRYGDLGTTTPESHLYVLDTKNNDVHLVSSRPVNYALVSWSPDGNYIAYMENGDYQGRLEEIRGSAIDYLGPLRLYICNWRTGQEYLVRTNDNLNGPFYWIGSHTLVYDSLSQVQQELGQPPREPGNRPVSPPKSQGTGGQKAQKDHPAGHSNTLKSAPPPGLPAAPLRPNIYAYSVETGQSRLLIKDGHRAVPSPDGQWIAFYGSANVKQPYPLQDSWERGSLEGMSLCVARRDGSGRIAFNPVHSVYPQIQWLPDSRHFLTIAQTEFSPGAAAEITEWNLDTQGFRRVATLSAKDYQKSSYSPVSPTFRAVSTARDGSELYVVKFENVGEVVKSIIDRVYVNMFSLQRINLKTGEVTTIAQVKNADGIDWWPALTATAGTSH